jgi:SAM-dependent methyltransferase
VAVSDAGCGPGHVTAHLRKLGLDAFGIDLSPAMIDVARREHPELRFEVGSMTDLELADASVAGLLAFAVSPPRWQPGCAMRGSRSRPTCWSTRTSASPERSFSHAVSPRAGRSRLGPDSCLPADLHVVAGAPHGLEGLMRGTAVSRRGSDWPARHD